MTKSQTSVLEELRTTNGDGDHDLFAHYAHKADIMRSLIEGVPIMALCGKVWVPSKNPDNYPVCPTCKEIFEQMP